MLPLLAASAASSTIDKLTNGAESLWKKVSGKSGGAGNDDPVSFASLLSGQGVDTGGLGQTKITAAANTAQSNAASALNRIV